MKPFLSDVADKIEIQGPSVVIAPNRRALLYIRKSLGEAKAAKVWFYTIEDFITGFSNTELATKVELIPLLHESYRKVTGFKSNASVIEQLVDFYFWGDMLLKDFDVIDHYCQDPTILFRDLTSIKELDVMFDYLTEEQLAYLEKFWDSVDRKQGEHREQFLLLWNKLLPIYAHFKDALKSRNIGYGGMVYRQVADNLENGFLAEKLGKFSGRNMVFVGFNALTKTEERVLSYFVSNNDALIHWDVDAFYMQDKIQEAGIFFREYKNHPVLGKTFPAQEATRLKGKRIHVIASATPIGQVKTMASMVERVGGKKEETLVVLPDEKLLTPVLHSIAPLTDYINVTMGYPLSSTPLASFIELFFDIHLTRNDEGYYHRPVNAFLSHPYMVAQVGDVSALVRKELVDNNWVRIPQDFLSAQPGLENIFRDIEPGELPVAATELITSLTQSEKVQDLDKDFLFYFLGFLEKLQPVMDELAAHDGTVSASVSRSFVKLFRQLLNTEKLPFEGDPMVGMQVMGVLETRNLDFKNVFILSMNEGIFPQQANNGSFIPYSLRKAYNLPTHEHREAMYAYLFYRLLQRSENIYLFYSSSKDVLGQGEISRFVQQLQHESELEIKFQTQSSKPETSPVKPIQVEKTPEVIARMKKIGLDKGFSPSALNTYLECELKFFYRYVIGLREADFVEEDLDARVLGDVMHRCMEMMYRDGLKQAGDGILTKGIIDSFHDQIDTYIDKVFRERFNVPETKTITYKGQRLVVKEIVRSFIENILAIDLRYAPFKVEGLEKAGLKYAVEHDGEQVLLTGIVDRADSKGNTLRVVDYKTGKDDLNFSSVEELFVPSPSRNKAAFQTLFYAMLFLANEKVRKDMLVVPGLYNRKTLFDTEFNFGLTVDREPVRDVSPMMDEFKERLAGLVEQIFSSGNFKQTEDKQTCQYCEFKKICKRD
jgi:CRISPR/Cas system-associated exonuclease Cas4 (RecB family)